MCLSKTPPVAKKTNGGVASMISKAIIEVRLVLLGLIDQSVSMCQTDYTFNPAVTNGFYMLGSDLGIDYFDNIRFTCSFDRNRFA